MIKNITIAIDGPAGAGKSTVAKRLAKALSFEYVDTGAMYRALTLKVLKMGLDPNDKFDVIDIMGNTAIDFRDNHIYLDNELVDEQIRNNIINQNVSYIAKIQEVRTGMVKLQRQLAETKSIIMDGRDIGSVVLPDADYKFFITASVDERAKRRYKELIEKGEADISYEKIRKEIELRDHLDSTREASPLIVSEGAIILDTTSKSVDECVEELILIIEGK
ncbi:MAG: (d)CMP kinase [Tissierellaceae bacterium]